MRINYSADKRRREIAAKQKKEEKAKKMAERRELKQQYPDGIPPDAPENESNEGRDGEIAGNDDR